MILESLKSLKAEKSIQSLREKVDRLLSQLETVNISPPIQDSSNGTEIRFIRNELIQIADSQTLERAQYYLKRLEKSLTKAKTSKFNDINLNRWKEYDDINVDSLWVLDKRDNSGVHSAGYWGNYIPQIPKQMLKRYTKKGEWVLDCFLGSGTTLIESQRLGRNGIGIELQKNVAENARKLIESEKNDPDVISDVISGDSSEIDYESILLKYGISSFQLLIMHPPYYDIIKFSDNPRDLSNASDVDNFLSMMNSVVEKASAVLDKGRIFTLVIGDKYSKGEWIPLGFLTMNGILQRGFKLKSIIVKNFDDTTGKRQQKELWRYRALAGGFYLFKHEYIFIFQKK